MPSDHNSILHTNGAKVKNVPDRMKIVTRAEGEN